MKKIILILMLLASFQSFAGPAEPKPTLKGQDGGGGGVIKRNGMYLTFGSAGMKIEMVKLSIPQGLQEIPGLSMLVSLFYSNEDLTKNYIGKFIKALAPSPTRRYFKIEKSQLEQGTYERLIAEYIKLFKDQASPNSLGLAAITIADDTYLLPPFFELKPAEQGAILFHEALWIVKPEIQYAELVNAEMIMQKQLEVHGSQWSYDPEFVSMIGEILGLESYVSATALIQDIKMGRLKKCGIKIRRGAYDLYDLLPDQYSIWSKDNLSYDLYKAINKCPDVTFFKLIYSYSSTLQYINVRFIPADAKFIIGERVIWTGYNANNFSIQF
ncbi:MAG: hypothetical protein V4596_09935 [Bdellovibrionota bacterium]